MVPVSTGDSTPVDAFPALTSASTSFLFLSVSLPHSLVLPLPSSSSFPQLMKCDQVMFRQASHDPSLLAMLFPPFFLSLFFHSLLHQLGSLLDPICGIFLALLCNPFPLFLNAIISHSLKMKGKSHISSPTRDCLVDTPNNHLFSTRTSVDLLLSRVTCFSGAQGLQERAAPSRIRVATLIPPLDYSLGLEPGAGSVGPESLSPLVTCFRNPSETTFSLGIPFSPPATC